MKTLKKAMDIGCSALSTTRSTLLGLYRMDYTDWGNILYSWSLPKFPGDFSSVWLIGEAQ